jgi:hypothetical protein
MQKNNNRQAAAQNILSQSKTKLPGSFLSLSLSKTSGQQVTARAQADHVAHFLPACNGTVPPLISNGQKSSSTVLP